MGAQQDIQALQRELEQTKNVLGEIRERVDVIEEKCVVSEEKFKKHTHAHESSTY